MSRIVITGAPGVGKTTLLGALQARGYTIVGDTARTIIQDRRRRGLSPRPDPYAFAQEALRMDIDNFVHHAASPYRRPDARICCCRIRFRQPSLH
jgi:predicted ATPase